MRFLLCAVNAKYIHSNLAVFSLKAYAEKYGTPEAEYIIREYTINHYVEDILRDLYEAAADVVVFSCYIWNISQVEELAAELKKVAPGTAVWAGGPEVSWDAAGFLQKNPAVDLVMRGEGEEVFTALAGLYAESGAAVFSEALFRRRLPGVAFRSGGPVVDGGLAPRVDMNRIPFVYQNFELFSHKIIYYETSRGCPFSCSYCLSSVDKGVRFRDLSLVKEELDAFLTARIPQVKLVDRTFNCNGRRAMQIWRYILAHDNGVTNFHFEISADLLGEEELALFARMRPGLIQLEIGVQSTNPETVEAIRRRMDLPKLFANVDRVRAMGNIHQHLDLIAGLPKEDYASFARSFDDLYRHGPDQLQLGFLKVLKGTAMEGEAERWRLLYRERPPYEVLSTAWLSYADVIRLKGVEALVETYYNSGQFTYTLRYAMTKFSSPFFFYESFARFYKTRNYHKINHNRLEKYRILKEFLEECGEELPLKEEMLTLDYYLRENGKARPPWAPDLSGDRPYFKELYRREGARLFPHIAPEDYDSRYAANHSRIEPFSFRADRFMRENVLEAGETLCLFDYERRNPLNREAACVVFPRDGAKTASDAGKWGPGAKEMEKGS